MVASSDFARAPMALSPEAEVVAIAALRAYLDSPLLADGRTPTDLEAELDARRLQLISQTLKPLVARYLDGDVSTADFKRQIDGLNKRNPLWGFSGIKGQMFFNMLTKTAHEASGLDTQLRSAMRVPQDDLAAHVNLGNFCDFVAKVGERFIEAGGDSYNKPKPSSVPYFLSYFWQIQLPNVWPVYYTNTVQMIEKMNLWRATGNLADDYIAYKRLHESLQELFSRVAGRSMSFYDVEHVFWFKSGKLLAATTTQSTMERGSQLTNTVDVRAPTTAAEPVGVQFLPDSYVPPIVSIIPNLAMNGTTFQDAARKSGTTIERALEKSINAAFTVLGYETQLLGQGAGRVPDGQAIAVDESYALLWDAKVRAEGYRMGTDDRAIRQYIDTQSRALKRARGLRNIYYLIISSQFVDEFDDLIRSLKMETNVNEVCLVEADALVTIVDQKLRMPLSVSLGPDGLQRLFSSSGIVSVDDVLENLS
jgi:hypothetical protein